MRFIFSACVPSALMCLFPLLVLSHVHSVRVTFHIQCTQLLPYSISYANFPQCTETRRPFPRLENQWFSDPLTKQPVEATAFQGTYSGGQWFESGHVNYLSIKAVPVIGLTPRRHGFHPGGVYVGFVVDG